MCRSFLKQVQDEQVGDSVERVRVNCALQAASQEFRPITANSQHARLRKPILRPDSYLSLGSLHPVLDLYLLLITEPLQKTTTKDLTDCEIS